jgi:hypothetical protein
MLRFERGLFNAFNNYPSALWVLTDEIAILSGVSRTVVRSTYDDVLEQRGWGDWKMRGGP